MRGIGALVFLLALASSAAAQDQQLGARTKAMGGSYTAFEDDPVSVWLNPAGISTQPDQASLAYQTYTGYPVKQDRGPANTTSFSVRAKSRLAEPAVIPSYIGFVYQLGSADDPMALGFCFARPYLLHYAMDQITSPGQTVFSPQSEVQQSLSRFRFAFAKDFLLHNRGEGEFLNHVSVGLGLDVGYERWEFRSPSISRNDSDVALGYGVGVLAGLYDNMESLKVNVGLAYQSPIYYDFNIDPEIQPAFDMPGQFNVGVMVYFLPDLPLRATVDVQFIQWSRTAVDSLFAGQPKFRDVTNFSVGFEYRIRLSEKFTLYPRVGYRRFQAPWSNPDNLPATGAYKLVLDTRSASFNIGTFGAGVSWTNEAGKVRSFDLAGDAGGDAVNVALGYTHEF